MVGNARVHGGNGKSEESFLFYISGYRIAGGLLWSSSIITGQHYLDEPHSLVKLIDGIELKA